MKLVDAHVSTAPADLCLRVAADVERWPDILPHYRWVRFRRKEGLARGEVEMAAWRWFGPVGWPAWWLSEMEHDPRRRTVRYRHVRGVTKGMDVAWEVSPRKDGRTDLRIIHRWAGPRWPLVGRFAAEQVIGPHFVSAIARRTLAGVASEAERLAALAGKPTGDGQEATRR